MEHNFGRNGSNLCQTQPKFAPKHGVRRAFIPHLKCGMYPCLSIFTPGSVGSRICFGPKATLSPPRLRGRASTRAPKPPRAHNNQAREAAICAHPGAAATTAAQQPSLSADSTRCDQRPEFGRNDSGKTRREIRRTQPTLAEVGPFLVDIGLIWLASPQLWPS